ncbi:hypothetical protein GI374_12135 [Paracoccus sp. S-4012]|uniref:hypothetical protein n=1 Tax=Paracoccus sp. S-4012 TaxID=2665648 RepID=UPI0012B15AF9|nr:hypothetical protein [Paracoccus sp. S-4012]MRX51184.1 hypothetical protein [Paracoccus sp. S-4012]
MVSAARIRDLLPSLWRPEDEASLMARLIAAGGQQLDRARIEAGDTMQAHWLAFADGALTSPFVAARRRAGGLAPLLPGDPAVAAHPFLDDLPRLAGLLGLRPHDEPAGGRETVEAFRARVVATVVLWKEGLATREALLQAARLALSGMAERAVSVEEFAPGAATLRSVSAGPPEGLVGPLIRWTLTDPGVSGSPVEAYIEGVTPVPGEVDATETPLIERFDPATGTGIGLVYDGTLAPGQVLALLPGFASWLGGPEGLRSAVSVPGADPADPTAAGPWVEAEGAPALPVRALAIGADGGLWAAVEDGGTGALWRLGAGGWAQVLAGLPEVHCLLAPGRELLVGHASGVSRLDPFAAPALVPDPATGTGPAVRALVRAPDGTVWAATDTGAARLGPGDAAAPAGPATPLTAVQADPDGILHFGGAAGLFRHDPATDAWHAYLGAALEDTVPDWAPFDPAGPLPDEATVFLPAVTAILRGPDASLWLGTDAGLARYGARRFRGTYATRLTAYPALGTAPVRALAMDERQRLWAGTDRGLLVFDGRDWFEAAPSLTRLPRPAADDPGTGSRFDRAAAVWQSATAGAAAGFTDQTPPVITAERAAVRAIHWTDHAIARLGTFEGGAFVPDPDAAPAPLRLRVKPEPTRIVEGGIPALPRTTPGTSHWRYLALEEAAPPAPRTFPAWTREGRLLTPPDEAPAPEEGRFLAARALAELDRVYAFNPAARVRFRLRLRAPLSITVRIERLDADETLPAVVLDRVFAAVNMVRPAGARIRLAHGETVVRGGDDG